MSDKSKPPSADDVRGILKGHDPIIEFTEDQLYVIHVAASDLFEQAVAQGMHTPFSLDVHSWGFTWADKLVRDLTRPEGGER